MRAGRLNTPTDILILDADLGVQVLDWIWTNIAAKDSAVAEYRPAVGAPVACRVLLTHGAPYLDDLGQVTDYRTRAEVALIEVGRPQVDDRLLVGDTLYTVIAYASDTDDGVVRGLWVEAS